jgi:hypothetical protein
MIRTFPMIALILAAAVAAVSQSVSGSVTNIRRGAAGTATVILSIPPGYHVNSNRPTTRNLIPTSVRADARSARVSRISYPKGRNKRFPFSDEPLNVYEGRVKFRFKVTVPKGFRGNRLEIRVAVSFQPCTDEVCFQPRTEFLRLRARVR